MPFFFVHTPELIRIIMTVSSVTARVLSLAVLILSIAPLGSLYVLLCSLATGTFPHYQLAYQPSSSSTGASTVIEEIRLVKILQDPNASMEDLWNALVNEQWTVARAEFPLLFHYLPIHERAAKHLILVLPWLICTMLGVLVGLGVMLYWILARQSWHRAREVRWHAEHNVQRRKAKLQKRLQNYTKVLTVEDIVVDQDNDYLGKHKIGNGCTSLCSTADTPWTWRLPLQGSAANDVMGIKALGTRDVVGTCVICLCHYEVGEKASWSSNPHCRHVFHSSCIQSWLLRRQAYSTRPCPCCRQVFTVKKLKDL
jgi:uncharacterized membrane protein YciS (DUF1049 family)